MVAISLYSITGTGNTNVRYMSRKEIDTVVNDIYNWQEGMSNRILLAYNVRDCESPKKRRAMLYNCSFTRSATRISKGLLEIFPRCT